MDWKELTTELMRFLQASEIEVPNDIQHHYDRLLGSLFDQDVPEGATLIPLTQGQVALVDIEDLPKLQKHKWFACKSGAGTRSQTYYVRAKINGRGIPIHRFLMDVDDPSLVVDHKNHDTLDNRKSNLRVVDRTQSAQNRRGWYVRENGVPYKGVYQVSEARFRSVIKKDKIIHDLGYFKTAEEAALAYDAKATELHGEFAVINFPSERIP
jgi:hypothetical protein